ncbi:MAG TPA: DUF1223 domain-containing protein [Rhizomicrobium sp.]
MVQAMSFARVLRLPAVFLALAGCLFLSGADAGGARRPVVVELYTSQGCNSCPPADALLSQLAARKDVIAISLPITYWDMLGWKDTLATDADTRRQKAYSQALGRGGVYTPQMVIDGVNDVVGSKDAQVSAAIAARQADEQNIAVSLSANRQVVHVAVGADAEHGDNNATIWLFRILPQASVSVTGGENSGHTLAYRNVVRDVRAIGMWKGQPVSLDLPRAELTGNTHDSIAVIVQQGGYGRIVGAAMIDHPDTAATR